MVLDNRNDSEYYYKQALYCLEKALEYQIIQDPFWEDIHLQLDAAEFFEKAAMMGHLQSMLDIFMQSKLLDDFEVALTHTPIFWLAEYIERANLQLSEELSFSDIENDNLLNRISLEDLTIMRQNSDSPKVQDFCDKLEQIIIRSYNSDQ